MRVILLEEVRSWAWEFLECKESMAKLESDNMVNCTLARYDDKSETAYHEHVCLVAVFTITSS